MNPYYKNRTVYSIVIILVGLISFGFMIQSCSSDSDINKAMSNFTTYLSIDKSDFDFGRDWESLSESDKTTFNLAHNRMDFTFDKDGICTTKWTSSSQVNMSDELFNYFINIIAFTNEMTKKLSEGQEFTPPRLKTGNECNPSDYSSRIRCCVVQNLYSVIQNFRGSYSLTAIDNWLCSNNYCHYNPTGRYYGIYEQNVNAVLSHFLSGTSVSVSVGNLTNSDSSKCILILDGSPLHAVIFTFYDGSLVHYNDLSGTSLETSCSISDIRYVFKATGVR
jgi:hypothetical protein